MSEPYVVEAGVKQWWQSKVNWAQFAAVVAMVVSTFGFDFTAEMQAQVVAFIVALQAFVTFVLRTWKTQSLVWNSIDGVVSEEPVEYEEE